MFTPEELGHVEIFTRLDAAECARLAETVADVRLKPGEWFASEGEPACFFVVFEGRMRLVVDVHGKPTEFAAFDSNKGDFAGEVPLLLRTPFFASIRAETPCRVARLDKQQFHHLIRDSVAARELILQQISKRLLMVQERTLPLEASRVFFFGRNRDEDCREIRTFLSANRIPFEWVDRDLNSDRVPAGATDDPDCPIVTIDGEVFSKPPTTRDIANALRLQTATGRDKYEVSVVGGGPAGMAAAVYGSSEGLTVLIVERCACGGQAGTSARIENYLGFPEGISGNDLTERGYKQATRFGAEVALTRSVEKLIPTMAGHICQLD